MSAPLRMPLKKRERWRAGKGKLIVAEHGTFQCIVIAPLGRLIDFETTSVTFPAHDGQVGVMHNHMPMFCKLGLGIMEVKQGAPDQETSAESIFLLIDGGFAMVGLNLVRLVVYDAVSPKDTKVEKIEHLIEDVKKKTASGTLTMQQCQHNTRKISLLTELIEMSKHSKDKHTEPASA
jgi:F0F1-type ATP synthase epsilon subunit